MPVPFYHRTKRKGIVFPTDDSNHDGLGEEKCYSHFTIVADYFWTLPKIWENIKSSRSMLLSRNAKKGRFVVHGRKKTTGCLGLTSESKNLYIQMDWLSLDGIRGKEPLDRSLKRW